MMNKRFLLCLVVLCVLAVAYLAIGSVNVFGSGDWKILRMIRLPRMLMVIAAGAALAMAGLAFQSLLRNPLATPFTLGVSSGSALGAVIAIKSGLILAPGLPATALFSFAGALIIVGVVYRLARVKGRFTTATLLLSGVSLNFLCSGLILFLHYLSDFTESSQMIRWLMGGFLAITYIDLALCLPVAAVFGLFLLVNGKALNLISLGDEIAITRGIDVISFQRRLFVLASLMTAVIISVTGPIGFVGLIVPHICRLLFGANHARLLPAVALLGAAFLLAADLLARVIISPAQIPVGVLTAILGGPFFLFILRKTKGGD